MAIKVTIDDNFNNPKVKVLMLKGEKGDQGDLNHNDIVDNLTSTATNKVLSAKQGKVLKGLVDTNTTNIATNTTNISNEITARQNADANLQSQINGLASGSPLTASSISDMTDTTKVYVLTTDGHWYYYDGSNWVDGGVYTSVTGYDEAITDLTINSNNFKFPTINILDSVSKIYNKNLVIAGNLTINNFEENLVNSTYANYITLPFRIKYDTGSPIFDEWNFNNITTDSSADFIHYFDKNGNYLSSMKFNNANKKIIPANAYYVSFVQYNTSSEVLTYKILNNDNVNVEWLNNDIRTSINNINSDITDIENTLAEVGLMQTYIVDINSTNNNEYTSFMECINDIQNVEGKKIIYVKAGTYNIFEEIGGSEFALNIDSSSTWEQVSTFIPDNTKIIGLGDVIFNFLPELNEISETGSSYLSCLNVRGNLEMENVKLFAKNCRYTIHDEAGDYTEYYDKSKIYRNVEIHYITGRNSGVGGTAYGCGFQKGMQYDFEDCIIESTGKAFPISFHNGIVDGGGNINFINCIFKSANSNRQCLELIANASSTREIKVNISNCYMNNKGINIIPMNQWLTISNPFMIYVKNSNAICSSITINTTENFTNTKIPEIYNTIS